MRIAIPLGPEEKKYQLNTAYIDYIGQAGYDPMPCVPDQDALMMADLCDGLLLPGGKDIDPIFYGDSNWGSFWADSFKDDFERRFFHAFKDAGKPVFGICRGFQLIAREYIRQHGDEFVTPSSDELISDRCIFQQDIRGHDCAGSYNLFRHRPHHYVIGREDLLYGGEKQAYKMAVNSMHHQYLHVDLEPDKLLKSNKVTPHMRATAWTTRGLNAEESGVVCEAAYFKKWGKAPIAGVQWHPEELKDYALLHFIFGKSKSFRGPETIKAAI
jgi:gamma-glutamyl-gamma-aminobutyrate hydrolase PuuD